MTEIMWIFLAWFLLLTAARIIQPITLFIQLLRTPTSRVRLTSLTTPPILREDEQGALRELEALGFCHVEWSEFERGQFTAHSALLRHESKPIFAGLSFVASYAGYSITFYSFTTEGTLLATCNRCMWAISTQTPGVEFSDAYAASLADHLAAHRARSAGAVDVDSEVARQRIRDWSEGYFDRQREAGDIRQVGGAWYPTVRNTLQICASWMKIRKELAKPYHSSVTDGEHLPAFAARYYQQMETFRELRRGRRDIKLWLLAVSMMVSVVGWWLLFNLEQAFFLMLILLLHEGGHALAMRAFGYRDMSMVFLPMLGAVVTGTPSHLSAWKRVVILLAGPLPGLFIGLVVFAVIGSDPELALRWQFPATMAVIINLFNLLPIAPLDGGQLVEVALFSRWPRARLLFYLLSSLGFIALAFWLKGPFIWVLALLVVALLPGQWRIARLQRAWRDEFDDTAQLTHLFTVTRQSSNKKLNVLRQIGLVKSVFQRRSLKPARLWESGFALVILLGVWTSVIAMFTVDMRSQAPEADTRTQAQRAFDDAMYEYEDGDDYDESTLASLDRLAPALDADDARRTDLQFLHAELQQAPARQEKIETIIALGRDGLNYSLSDMAANLLSDTKEVKDEAPSKRAARLLRAAEHITTLAPAAYDGTITTRLRAAEAWDQAGKPQQALATLGELSRHIAGECSYYYGQLVKARTWYYLAHSQPELALKAIETSSCAGEKKGSFTPLGLDYAWALLAAGRTEEGIKQMRLATYTRPYVPTLLQRLRGARSRPASLIHPLDMAYALRQAGDNEAARRLITRKNSYVCWRANTPVELHDAEPWQQSREAALTATAHAICPAQRCTPEDK